MRLLFIVTLLLSATACNAPDARCTPLMGQGSYCLQPTSAISAFEVQQKLTIQFKDRIDALIVELEVDANELRLVGLTPFGHKLLQLRYDKDGASASTLPDARLSPTQLVALLQVALWPTDAVRTGLASGLILEENASQRRILNGNDPILTVTHTGDTPPYRTIHIMAHTVGFDLTIETLQPALEAKNTL